MPKMAKDCSLRMGYVMDTLKKNKENQLFAWRMLTHDQNLLTSTVVCAPSIDQLSLCEVMMLYSLHKSEEIQMCMSTRSQHGQVKKNPSPL